MITIPWCAHSYCDDNIAWGRWDQLWLGRILAGTEGHPPGGVEFYESTFDDVRSNGGVLVLPVGYYREHGEHHEALRKIWADLEAMPWGVVFATSDEANRFEWHKIDPWPDHIQLYVQLPRVSHTYPPRTRFFGEGSPVSVFDIQANAVPARDLDFFLLGQGGHERRDQCFDALIPMRSTMSRRVVERTDGFTQGMSQDEYLAELTATWVAPAPSGICSQSSFRAFEALEAGAIPIVDGIRPGPEPDPGFWELLGMGDFLPVIDDWSMVGDVIDGLLENRCFTAAKVSSGWQQYKRDFVRGIHDAVHFNVGDESDAPHDQITVVVPTSPVPSNPSLDIIQETIASIRTDLPGAEILITCDGIRDEQADRRADYHTFLHNLCVWTLTQHNVTPFVYGEHLHQSGMMRAILPKIRTEYLLYVEHDCPIVAPVPWDMLLGTVENNHLNSLRLMHEATVLDSHRHLYLDGPYDSDIAGWLPTVQWSQRPHLASVAWYGQIMATYFGANARTMIEDVMHGVVQHGWTFTDGIPSQEMWGHWEQWRMAVYAPEGSMKRSGHLDGRGDDPKYPMLVAYDNGRPEGAPREGMIG